MKMPWAGLIACALLLVPPAAMADAGAQAAQVRSSMVVSGTIVIQPDGSVASYVLDQKDKLPAGALKVMARYVPQWTFKPVLRDGAAVTAKSEMSVRLVARSIGEGKVRIAISGAHFGHASAITYAKGVHRRSPRYPRRLAREGVSGTVYLMLEVGRDGSVQHVAAQQVNLFVRGSTRQMKRWRQALAEASIDAARHWTFDVSTDGANADRDHWIALAPVNFHLRGWRDSAPDYGEWQAYMPGPRQFIPWLDTHLLAAGGVDAMPAGGGLYSMQQSLHLLSPLAGADPAASP